jgi:hypothetical protein
MLASGGMIGSWANKAKSRLGKVSIFMLLQLVYTTITLLPMTFFFHSMLAHTLWVFSMLTWSIIQGANFCMCLPCWCGCMYARVPAHSLLALFVFYSLCFVYLIGMCASLQLSLSLSSTLCACVCVCVCVFVVFWLCLCVCCASGVSVGVCSYVCFPSTSRHGGVLNVLPGSAGETPSCCHCQAQVNASVRSFDRQHTTAIHHSHSFFSFYYSSSSSACFLSSSSFFPKTCEEGRESVFGPPLFSHRTRTHPPRIGCENTRHTHLRSILAPTIFRLTMTSSPKNTLLPSILAATLSTQPHSQHNLAIALTGVCGTQRLTTSAVLGCREYNLHPHRA